MGNKILNIAVNLILLFLSTLLSLLVFVQVSEFITVISMHDQSWHDVNTRFDSEIGWAPIPHRRIFVHNRQISSNSLGFRSPEVDRSKKHIILVGDSVVWGYGVGDDETAAFYLQRDLDKDNFHDLQVLNLGVSGYGIDQYYLWLKRNIDKLNPQTIIVVIQPECDHGITRFNRGWGKSKPLFVIGSDGNLKNINPNIFRYCPVNLLDMLPNSQYGAIDRWIRKFADVKTMNEPSLKKVVILLFTKLNQLAADHHANLIFMISPQTRDYSKEGYSDLFFKGILKSQGYPFFDFSSTVKDNKWDIKKIYLYDHCHFTPYGNELFAQTIKSILDLKLHQTAVTKH